MPNVSQPSPLAAELPDLEWSNGSRWNRLEALWGNRSWNTAVICESFLDYVRREFSCAAAVAWSLDPVNQLLIALAHNRIAPTDMQTITLKCSDCLSGYAVDRKQISRFEDLRTALTDGRSFKDQHLAQLYGLTGMLSLPVVNTTNPNQVLLVVNLFVAGGTLPPSQVDDRLYSLARDLAATVEACLYDRCIRYTNRLPIALAQVRKTNPDRQCGVVARVVRSAIDCDAVGVYLASVEREHLELVGKDDPGGMYDRMTILHFSAEKSWSSNREVLHVDLGENAHGGAREDGLPRDDIISSVCLPLQALSGQSRGVIQCLNRNPSSAPRPLRQFTYDDVAVIEAIGRSFSPQLAVLQADQQRIESLNRLAHELRVPVVAFRAALDRVRKECFTKGYTFQFEHFEEMVIYGDVMNRLLKELDLMRRGTHSIPLVPQKTYLLRKIIAPAVRFVRPLLLKAGFDSSKNPKNPITYRLDNFPDLYVDPGLMTQVVFNLLDNAIKYYQSDPDNFRILIEGSNSPEGFELLFRDEGIGIEPGEEKLIFEQGMRGRNAHKSHVSGTGIGLWLARAIVRRHGGDLFVRNNRAPTEIILRLPHNLVHGPPPDKLGVDG
jgi:signal transduction histidine kinase